MDGYAVPQLHTHAVIFSLTETGDGIVRALGYRVELIEPTPTT